jgi:hypothetical protein
MALHSWLKGRIVTVELRTATQTTDTGVVIAVDDNGIAISSQEEPIVTTVLPWSAILRVKVAEAYSAPRREYTS